MLTNQWIGNYYVDAQGSYCANKQGSIRSLLEHALLPVGNTVYVWDGGWNVDDATRIGVNPNWKQFFDTQDSSYDYNQTRYWHGYGLDCSGYLSWVLYNTLYTNSGNESFIAYAKDITRRYAERGFGTYTEEGQISDYRPGDVLCSSGHAFMVLGRCDDGSVVLFHSSPQGVQINGTVTPLGDTNSQAVKLAERYMTNYYPQWVSKFPVKVRGLDYLQNYSQFRWHLSEQGLMNDSDGYTTLSADDILKRLFHE